MILDYLDRIEQYDGCWPQLVEAVKFAETVMDKEVGRYEQGNYFALVQEMETKLMSEKNYELHREYVDVHIVIEGEEVMGYEDITKLTPIDEYNETKDIQFLSGEGQPVVIRPGMFSVVFPHDGHKPACCAETPAKLRKIVLKIPK